jgi:hypothetical protein
MFIRRLPAGLITLNLLNCLPGMASTAAAPDNGFAGACISLGSSAAATDRRSVTEDLR